MSESPTIPDGEIYVTHGQIVGCDTGGGGYPGSPGYAQYRVRTADGQEVPFTGYSYRSAKDPCFACILDPPENPSGGYGLDYWVLVTQLHGHIVVRDLDPQHRW